MPPAQSRMEMGGVSPSGHKYSAKKVEKKDCPQEQRFSPASLLHSRSRTNRSPTGRPEAKEWFKKWITHLGPKFEGEDQRDPVYILKAIKRKLGKCEKGESKQNKCQSATCNKLSVQREDNRWSSLSEQTQPQKEKKQSIDGNRTKNTQGEIHSVSNCVQSLQMNLNLYSCKTDSILFYAVLVDIFILSYMYSFLCYLVPKRYKKETTRQYKR